MPQQITAMRFYLLINIPTTLLTHPNFYTDSYHIYQGRISFAVDRSSMFAIISFCA